MKTQTRLVVVMSNGNGGHFATCHWCHASTAAHAAPDDLMILAGAKRKGWRLDKQEDDTYRLTCDRCQRRGR